MTIFFWRTDFLLLNAKDLQPILASSIKEVWIDCGKGLDIVVGKSAFLEVALVLPVEASRQQVVDRTGQVAPVNVAKERARATKIVRQSKQAVMFMFEEARMGNAVDVGGAKQLMEEISDSITHNPTALISLARLKTIHDYAYMYSVAVCAMMVSLAKQLGLEEAQVRSAGLAGLLHDLGKAVMPLEVLKKPGKLTEEEFSVIKSHPVEGHKLLLNGVDANPIVKDVCLHHHEKTDGSGYPDGSTGDRISLFAKMGAVCHVYDAITSNWPYKPGWDPAESLHKMAQQASVHFDPLVFQAFVKCMGIYLVGSLAQLTSGRIGVVVEQTSKSLTIPSVKILLTRLIFRNCD